MLEITARTNDIHAHVRANTAVTERRKKQSYQINKLKKIIIIKKRAGIYVSSQNLIANTLQNNKETRTFNKDKRRAANGARVH